MAPYLSRVIHAALVLAVVNRACLTRLQGQPNLSCAKHPARPRFKNLFFFSITESYFHFIHTIASYISHSSTTSCIHINPHTNLPPKPLQPAIPHRKTHTNSANMSGLGRKDVSDSTWPMCDVPDRRLQDSETKESITRDASKSSVKQTKESVTGMADKVAPCVFQSLFFGVICFD